MNMVLIFDVSLGNLSLGRTAIVSLRNSIEKFTSNFNAQIAWNRTKEVRPGLQS